MRYEIEYSIANGDGAGTYLYAFPSTTVVDSGDVLIPASTATRSHAITSLGADISGTGKKIGGYITFRFRRIALAGAGSAPTADPFCLAVGFHHEIDTVGSRAIFTK